MELKYHLMLNEEHSYVTAYLKSEADKVIAHNKYKRCLAMAKECEATALWCYPAANTLPTGFKATLFGKPVMIEPDRLYNRFERLIKWSNRWLKIAEQFKDKEAKKCRAKAEEYK